ncbi:MAG: calcineurin-like phosphoesterase C-terminal domain-containing protein [Bacteroidales bacterium]|nr:calcineurin-like phosphoesterase C-terminal domain-containing protein [Bacteroidales bacterium]
MAKSHFLWLALPVLAMMAASCTAEKETELRAEGTTLSINIPDAKTILGPSVAGIRNTYWVDGDCIAVNGTASYPLSGIPAESQKADFVFPSTLDTPYNIIYPASFYKDASTITLPAEQTFASGSFASGSEPLVGYTTSENEAISLNRLCGLMMIQLKKDSGVSASNIIRITFTGNSGEQVCGDFTIDYQNATLTGTSSAEADKSVSMTLSQPLDETDALEIFLVVPSMEYTGGFTVEMEDALHRKMTKTTTDAKTVTPGKLMKMKAFTFVPSDVATEFELEEIIEEVLVPDNYNVTGRVVDNSGNGIAGVVVTDGTKCVQTMIDGRFYMNSDIDNVKFVHISTPSGYMPQVQNGIPKFYKTKSSITPQGGVYDFGNYVITPVANPDHATILMTADPQPRSNNWGLDKIAYKALDVCQDLYSELKDVSLGISGRQVYGICLGDIVHESMGLYDQYNTALSTFNYPTYNIIGNHDNNPDAADDDAGAADFESYYGPRNYSFNIGGIHFVMLDNLIMKDNGEGRLTAFDQGLTDGIWTWLQADMGYISKDTKIMVCAHSPMFKQQSGSERTNSAKHGGHTSSVDGPAFGYGDLFDLYNEVHAWAGHTHSGFNFVYSSTHRHANIQVHTLARSTGELWTNEYLANGTPRGFTVVEIDNGEITWKFHPMTHQRGVFQGVTTGYCSAGAPAYDYRAWNYSGSGASCVAVMKDGSGALTEDYQMNVYPRGSYGDNYVYANIFLWDEKWGTPTWTPDGGTPVEMTRIYSAGKALIPDTDKIYDKGDTEFRTWYKAHADKSGGSLKGLDGYTTVAKESDGLITTLFRVPADATPSSGIVRVTDRFGNVYSRSVSW